MVADEGDFTGCSANCEGNLVRLICEMVMDGGDMNLKIYPALGDEIDKNSNLYFSVGFKNPSNDVNAKIYTYKHKDSESYSYE